MARFDLIILGGGAAGFAAAMKASDLGAKALMINDRAVGLGGTCVNVGCVPTKHLLHITEFIHRARNLPFPGVEASVSFDFRTLIREKDALIARMRQEKYEKVLKALPKVDFVEGEAQFVSGSQVQTNGKTFGAEKFIIATGSSPFVLPLPGMEDIDYLTNAEALELEEQPSSLLILGGRALAVEFAQLFSRLGTKVTLLQRSERILPTQEPELAELLMGYLRAEGIEIHTGVQLKSIRQSGERIQILAFVKGKERAFQAEKILMATGRRPNTSRIGWEKAGISLGRSGEILVDEEMRAAENVWAAGDVTGEPMLETVAAKEGMTAAHNALSDAKIKMDYRVVPRAIFCDPQLAVVGLTDAEANAAGMPCQCNTVPLELVPKARAIKDTRGAIKIVTNKETQEILGVHILSPQAADLIHEAVMILTNRMSIDDVIHTLHVFPTLSEAIKLGAQAFRRDITKMSCCAE
ncbi:MAG: mercury(II) reductase [Candidatus Aminicenantales bacterium]